MTRLAAVSRVSGVSSAIVLLLVSRSAAAADECGGPGHPGIVLRADGVDAELRGHVIEQLRAALAQRSFVLCEPGASEGAVAELDVTDLARREVAGDAAEPRPPAPPTGAGVALTLSLRDAVTDKRVSRDIDLRRIPQDGRALVIAQAADELLRASWAELLLADAPKPRREVPPEVTRAVPPPEAPPPPPAPPRAPVVEARASFALEHFGTGLTQLGPDLSVSAFPFPRLGAAARAGIRSGARAEVSTGSVDPSGVVVGLALLGAVLPRTGRIGLDAGPELFVTRVHYTAEAVSSGAAHSASATAIHVSAMARGWAVLVSPLRLTLGVSIGAPIHSVRAVAEDSSVASAGGVLLGTELGLGGAW